MTFRMVVTIDVESESEIPDDFSGRVRKLTNGTLDYTAWYSKGEMEDPAPTTPAYVRYRPSGEAKQERHYRLGRLHDPSADQPAVRGYFANGALKYEERYRYGRRHDHRGTPAIIKWRLDGTVRTQRHYWEGLHVDELLMAASA
jgi:antitoxin component YwqK of YwqJK toxin-antitoxin module